MPNTPLATIRAQIDALDEQIQTLINQRAQLAQQVALIKQQSGEQGSFYRPEREAQVIGKVLERNQGPYPDKAMAGLFREIMSNCLALEQPLKIAFLGPEGTYTHMAALKHFGQAIGTLSQNSIAAVFASVSSNEADFGVVPIENSSEGVISHTLDTFITSHLQICGEVSLPIAHNLLSDQELTAIHSVYAHAQSLGQCRHWLDKHLPQAARIAVYSNAEAVRIAKQENQAAIASALAATLYALPVQAANIADSAANTTRFLVIGNHAPAPSGNDLTSLMLSAKNQAGALYQLLEPLYRQNISMTRIESRPSRQSNWEYFFFLDILGHAQDPQVAAALKEVQAQAALFKIIGSYPRALI